ncbi:hypothetical protein BU204_30845 [Actinophytocola xanthii]|uniref:Haem-binding uptake Tiki superfamily ChaN domain-containing protein n=1 Tax=Actinophytocola xanthii TaxID=1912961 RepID=A0A1Q8C8X4_9PSEU|nr:hypothetical protein BU204_30845 [Actinophytocola xanthii]
MAATAAAGTTGTASAAPTTRTGKPRSAVDGLLNLFAATPVVALDEGAHHLQDTWDFLAVVMQHPRFDAVDAVVVEFGNSRYQNVADAYVSGEIVRRSDLQPIWRDTTQSPNSNGDFPALERVFSLTRAINLYGGRTRPLRVLLPDPPIDWLSVTGSDDLFALLPQRNQTWSNVIIREVLDPGRRCIAVGGGTHFFRGLPNPSRTVTAMIEQRHPGSVSVVRTHSTVAEGREAAVEATVAGWPRPAIAPARRIAYGALPATDVFGPGSYPPGLIEGLADKTVADLCDHVLCLGRRTELTSAVLDWQVYYEPTYWAELNRRKTLVYPTSDLEDLRHEGEPTMFPN